jgi:hypothetical protein
MQFRICDRAGLTVANHLERAVLEPRVLRPQINDSLRRFFRLQRVLFGARL